MKLKVIKQKQNKKIKLNKSSNIKKIGFFKTIKINNTKKTCNKVIKIIKGNNRRLKENNLRLSLSKLKIKKAKKNKYNTKVSFLMDYFFRKKIIIAKWELNLFGVVAIGCGVVIGIFLTLNNLLPVLAAPTQASVTITSDIDWNNGTTSDITVGSGSIQINGNGGSNWWSGSYSFRKQITVTNNVGSDMPTDYTVSLTQDHAGLVTGGKSLASGDDIRIVYWNGSSNIELDRTLADSESWNQFNTTIQFKTQALISASSTDTNYYLYYGNPSAVTPPVDKTGVFALWDDFNDGNANGWTTAAMGGTLVSAAVSSGEYRVDVNGNWIAFWNTTVGMLGDYEQLYKVTADAFDTSHLLLSAGGRYQNASGSYLTGRWSNNHYLYRRVGGAWQNLASNAASANSLGTQYYFKVQFINYDMKLKVWQVGQPEPGSWDITATDGNSNYATGYPGFSHYPGIARFDDFQVRKIMSMEPSTSLGSEISSLQSPGTYTSQNLDANKIYAWGDCTGVSCTGSSSAFTANVAVPTNTSALFELRHSADGSTGWSTWTTIHNQTLALTGTITKTRTDLLSSIGDISNRYIQIKVTLSSTDGTSNPSVADYQLDYTTDVDAPTNPNSQNGYSDNGMGTGISTTNWYSHTAPHFTWSGATDTDAGMSGGYSGYWVCFGAVNCEPTSGTFVSSAAYTASSLTSNQTYYLKIKSRDAAGNVALTAYSAFEYRYDSTAPVNPTSLVPTPAGFTSNQNNFSFTWNNGTDTSGSGIKEYCYKTGAIGFTETCIPGNTVNSISAYQDGSNVFYVRSKDNVDNMPVFYTQVNYYYSGNYPTPPQGLSATPTTNTSNSFTFDWFLPVTYTGTIAKYHYSINALPSASNTTATTTLETTNRSVGPGAFATQQGSNLFYVVAEDDIGVNWDAYSQVEFTASTTAPGIPTSTTVTDSSIRAESKYLLTITWNQPADVGSGIDHYVVERSTSVGCATDPNPDLIFSEYAQTINEGYLDSGLSNTTTYCYRVRAADNAGAESIASSIVSALPEGRYTAPPTIIVNPEVSPLIQSAIVTWKTDREGSSFVEFGTTNALGRVLGQDDFITDHSVNLIGLEPSTTYYYKVKFTDQDSNTGYSSVSTFTTADAPSAPTSLTVTPLSSTTNSFAFSWSPPADVGVTIQGYYYSINSTPTSTNVSYTTQVSLESAAFATQQGINTFYVVAMDSDNNVNYNNYASINFSATTPAPAIPTGLILTDSSNRENEVYSITLVWQEVSISSANTGSNDVVYIISRSIDGGITFTEIAETATYGYLDVGLVNTQEYFYYIKTKDSAGSASAASSTVSDIPEGRFTTPPEITKGPIAVADSFSTVVSWNTERPTTSFVQYGLTETLGEEQGESDLITEHINQILGLNPETTYSYRIKSVDIDGNIALSPISTFTTLEAPRVSEVLVNDIKLYDALVTWITNKDTTSKIEYGSSISYGSVVYDTSNSLTKSHTLKLTGLVDGTTYHFRPTGEDDSGNPPESGDYSFQTLTFPEVLSINYENKSEGQTEITWTTNVPTTSIVEYYNENIAPKTQGNQAYTTDHSVLLFGLEDATVYQYKVKGTDQFGYNAESEENEFITLEDTTPPEIFSTQSESNTIGSGEVSKVQIVVSWKTDEPTTSQVEFGVGLGGSDYTDETEENAELVMDHLTVISGLAPAKTYHFRVVSADKADNQTKSGSYTVLTSRKKESFLQLIISNLEETFSWIGNMGNLVN